MRVLVDTNVILRFTQHANPGHVVAVNGFGMLVANADQQIHELLQHFTLLQDERGIYSRWHDLVVTYNVQGKQAHDTRLVAAMERHGVRYLLTFNTSDFARFPRIVAHSPAEIMTGIALT